MSLNVKRLDLITYERMAEIIGDVTDSPDPRGLLRRWKDRHHIDPVREDLALFEWSKVRPIIAARLGQPDDAWLDEPAYIHRVDRDGD